MLGAPDMFTTGLGQFGSLVAALAMIGSVSVACAQQGNCPGLTPIPGPDGYQLRRAGERCEGLYSSQVSAPPIELVSLTLGQLEYDLNHPMVLEVRPVSPHNTPITVRAVGIMPGLYYRL